MVQPREVFSAGAVVFRPGRQVLLVHRARYDDWSFPKGKLDPGEHRTAAAVREVEEETGLRVRLGAPLGRQRYPISGGRTKVVDYWCGRVLGDDDVSGYARNDEIDDVAWVGIDEALRQLTYPFDRDTLREAAPRRHRTEALVVLRHAEARARKSWPGEDAVRPLTDAGRHDAAALVPLLAAYDVGEVVSSSATRCVETVAPYAAARGALGARGSEPRLLDELTEERATEADVLRTVEEVVGVIGERRVGAVLCTHRPVLPLVFEALGVPDPGLAKGAMLVAHLRHGRVVAIERLP
ncbi:NUDIX domain-containing protein [Nocardioides sp. dk4132]|uniref:NUDIX hydrolase n=1 Tax=unclassified Nocardioides TaxID=2615069 RepID=UPI0012970B87|nr:MULTISPECIES: NUDIX domain-containing protein [unclassified Nocardioides]MQW77979.1 NUDIX domain-containing protein [Nocardioides sp. dk4132]QGA09099.1 NUDIX domain-containing protein [Nocardioides sp. dk884]